MQIVTIFIINSKRQLLIQKRSHQKGGKYGITSGHTLNGENEKNGATREIKEELGINIRKQDLKEIFKTEINGVKYNLYYIKKEIDLKELTLQLEEVENVYWCTVEEVNELIQKNEFYEKQIEAFKIFEKYMKEELDYGNNSSMGHKQ